MIRIPVPDVVVVLPGIMGSVLAKDGQPIWSPSPRAIFRALTSFGRSLQSLEVDDDDWQQPDLQDGVTATTLMPDVHLIPGLWKIDGYTRLEDFLLTTFDLTRNENYFAFPYDWRRDNRANAAALHRASRTWLSQWRQQSSNPTAKLVLVGHSMGGLIARYFVECLEGWRDTRAVVTFGTPFYGSLNAVNFLLNGFDTKIPFAADFARRLQSLRSIHQLVPSYRCAYVDGTATTPAAAQLPGWNPAWDEALLSFTGQLDSAAASNRQDRAFLSEAPVYRPIVGTDQPTRQSVQVKDGSVTLCWDRGGRDEAGDGTVPLLSAALSGTEDQRTFAPEQHGQIQNYGAMLDHLKGVMTSLYVPRIDDLRAQSSYWFAYRAETLYAAGEPVTIDLAVRSSADPSVLPTAPATITIDTREATPVQVLRRELRANRDLTSITLPELTPGAYTVTITGGRGSSPVSDVIVVAEPDAEP